MRIKLLLFENWVLTEFPHTKQSNPSDSQTANKNLLYLSMKKNKNLWCQETHEIWDHKKCLKPVMTGRTRCKSHNYWEPQDGPIWPQNEEI